MDGSPRLLHASIIRNVYPNIDNCVLHTPTIYPKSSAVQPSNHTLSRRSLIGRLIEIYSVCLSVHGELYDCRGVEYNWRSMSSNALLLHIICTVMFFRSGRWFINMDARSRKSSCSYRAAHVALTRLEMFIDLSIYLQRRGIRLLIRSSRCISRKTTEGYIS